MDWVDSLNRGGGGGGGGGGNSMLQGTICYQPSCLHSSAGPQQSSTMPT